MNYLTVAAAVVAVSISHFFVVCFYNVFLHPLKSYPGPKSWAACRIPFTYYKLKGVLPHKVKELHDKYGDAVRIAPNFLDYNSSDAYEMICGFAKEGHKKNFPKDLRERGVTKNALPNIINADEENHRRFRRLQSHAFSDKALSSQEPLIQDYARQFISGLLKFSSLSSDNSINLDMWYIYTTFDLIGDLAFGEPFGCVKTGDIHPWIELLFKLLDVSSLINETRKYPIFGPLVFFLIPRNMRDRFLQHKQLSKEKAERRMDTPTDRPDFTSYILKYNETDKGMTREEIGENASILIFAGSETTASLLTGVTYYLLRTPAVMKNLIMELRSTFTNQEELTMHALASCKYLNAVLEEGLRMYPPVPVTLPRLVPQGGSFISGKFVPEGVTVGVNPLSAQFAASNFTKPYEFHPERWLNNDDVKELKSTFPGMEVRDPQDFEKNDKKASQPFSYGPANCIGKNLAYAEMRVLLGNLVWGFDLEGGDGVETWLERNRVYLLWKKPALNVKLRRVNV